MSFAAPRTTEATGLFAQVMGLVAATLGALTFGAYIGRDLSGGASLLFLVLSFGCIIGLNFARSSGGAAFGLLLATGLCLGLGMGGTLVYYASVNPGAVWQAAAATALFIGALGSAGYAVRSDLSAGYRVLFFLLLGLILFGIVTLFVSMPGANVIYAVLGLGIFGGYTVLDFNRMRSGGSDDAIWIAAGIFLDIFNVFLFFLQLFGLGRRRD